LILPERLLDFSHTTTLADAAQDAEGSTAGMFGRRLRRLAVERLQRGKEELFRAAGGFGSEFLGEACCAEEA
jgi:hypothetical protein